MNYKDLDISDDVIAAVKAGQKIDAIKILREQTSLDLADAKDAIDALARVHRSEAGDASGMVEEGGAGGAIKMVVAIAIILGVYFYFFAN